MKKIVIFTLLCTMVAIYIYNHFILKSDTSHNVVKKTTNPHPNVKKNIDTHTLNVQTTKEKQHINKPIFHSSDEVFGHEDLDETILKMGSISHVKPIAAINMKQNIIKNFKIGDSITLPNIDENIYELKIQNHFISERGSVSINGDFMENGITYHTILTEGENSAFISMNTPDGTYEIEFMNGVGLVYESTDIENAKIDYTKSDMIHQH